MFFYLTESLRWLPDEIRKPVLGFLAALSLVVLVKLVTLLVSLLATVLQILIPWK